MSCLGAEKRGRKKTPWLLLSSVRGEDGEKKKKKKRKPIIISSNKSTLSKRSTIRPSFSLPHPALPLAGTCRRREIYPPTRGAVPPFTQTLALTLTYPDDAVLGLELLHGVNVVVDQTEPSGLSTTKLSAEAEEADARGVADVVHLGKLLAELSLRDDREVGRGLVSEHGCSTRTPIKSLTHTHTQKPLAVALKPNPKHDKKTSDIFPCLPRALTLGTLARPGWRTSRICA